MQVSEAMTRHVIVIPPELSLEMAWEIMQRRHFRHLPVVSGGRLLGILSDRDVLLRARLDAAGELVVPGSPSGSAMTPSPHVCWKTSKVGEIAGLMVENKIDALPVVDEEDRLIGLVTSSDLLLLLMEREHAQMPFPFDFELEEHGAALS